MTQTIEVLVVELTNPLCRRQRRGNRRKATRKVKERKAEIKKLAEQFAMRLLGQSVLKVSSKKLGKAFALKAKLIKAKAAQAS